MTSKKMVDVEVCKQPRKAREESRRYKGEPARCRRYETRRSTGRLDGVEIWKQFEDLLIPRLRLTVIERAVYSHLLRHSRLEGKRRLRFSIDWAARGSGLTTWSVRKGLRRLVAKGALRLAERSKRGHLIEVRLPEEVRAARAARATGGRVGHLPNATDLEKADFWQTQALRQAIHGREGGRCFYCLRRVSTVTRCIDHVIPRARGGGNSYRNLVSSCTECNTQKCEWSAEELLRWLFRERRLGGRELKERLRALEKLAAGKLRPAIV